MRRSVSDEHVVAYAMRRERSTKVFHVVVCSALVLYCGLRAFESITASVGAASMVERVGSPILNGVAAALMIYSFSRPERYKLSNAMFSVGRARIHLERIESVRNARRAGWARFHSWSLAPQGLLISERGRRRDVYISPENPEQFLHDLTARCPHLELREGGFVRDSAARGPHLELRNGALSRTAES